MKGWIYIFTNRSMPDLVKIGYTDRDPSIRVAEQHSGLPYPHDLEYEILVEDAFNLEQIIHKRLSDYNESKEWFRIEVEEAVSLVKEIAGERIKFENYHKADREKAEKAYFESNKEQQEKIRINKILAEKRQFFESEKSKIMKTYEVRLQEFKIDLPLTQKYIWTPLTNIFLITMISAGIYSITEDGDLFWSSVWIVLWILVYLADKTEKKKERTKSSGYKNILAERDERIEEAFIKSLPPDKTENDV